MSELEAVPLAPRDPGPGRAWVLPPAPGHGGALRALEVSADGTRAATAGDDGWVKVWDLPELAPRARFRLAPGRTPRLALSADGRLLAYGRGRILGVIDPISGEERFRLEEPGGDVGYLEFGPGASVLLASRQPPAGLLVVEVATGQVTADLPVAGVFPRPAFFPRLDRVVLPEHPPAALGVHSLTSGEGLGVYSLNSGEGLGRFPFPREVDQPVLAVSPRAPLLAAGGKDGSVWILDVEDLELREIRGPGGPGVWVASFSPDGHGLAVADREGMVHLLDLRRGGPSRSFPRPNREAWGPIAFAGDDHLVLAEEGRLVAVRVADGVQVAPPARPRRPPRGPLAISPDGAALAITEAGAGLRLVGYPDGVPRWEGDRRFGSIEGIFFTGDGGSIGTPIEAGGPTIRWDAATGALADGWFPREGPEGTYPRGHPAASSADGTRLAVVGYGSAWIVEAATGRAVSPELAHEGKIERVGFDPAGRLWVLGGNRGLGADAGPRRGWWVRRFDEDGAFEEVELELEPRGMFLHDLAPAAGAFASVHRDGHIRVQALPGGALLGELRDPPRSVRGGAFVLHPAARVLAYSGVEGGLVLFDLAAGRAGLLPAHDADVIGIAFPPSGDEVVTIARDGSVLRMGIEAALRELHGA